MYSFFLFLLLTTYVQSITEQKISPSLHHGTKSLGYVLYDRSSTTPLSAHETYISNTIDQAEFSLMVTTIGGSPENATGTLFFDYSPDGESWDHTTEISISNLSTEPPHTALPIARYCRIRYINNEIDQTNFRLQAVFHRYATKNLTAQLEQTINATTDVENVRAIIVGKNSAGRYENVKIGSENSLQTTLIEPLTSFGTIAVDQLYPLVQLKWPYHAFQDAITTSLLNSGNITSAHHQIAVSTGTTHHSSATLISKDIASYMPGQGIEARLSARFTAPQENTTQLIGLGTAENGLFFGYNGTRFGVMRRYGGQKALHKLTINQIPNRSLLFSFLNESITISSSTTIGEIAQKIANQDFSSYGYSTHYIGDSVLFASHKAEPESNQLERFLEESSLASISSFTTLVRGASPHETWIYQNEWNQDTAQGQDILPAINFTKGNVFRIRYQWLGFGIIEFSLENPNTGRFEKVHLISYASTATNPSLANPSLPFFMQVNNQSTDHDIRVYSSSVGIFLAGKKDLSKRMVQTYTDATIPKNKEKTILILQAPLVLENQSSYITSYLEELQFTNQGSDTLTLKIYKNPTLIGSPTFSPVAYSAHMQTCTDSLEITGGELLQCKILEGDKSCTIPLQNKPFTIYPGDMIALIAKNTSNRTVDLFTQCFWYEDI